MTAWLLLRFYTMALSLRYQGTPAPVRSLLALARALRAERAERRATFPTVPHGALLWGGPRPVSVRCRACSRPLRAGAKIEVRRVRAGVWECVRCDRPRVAGPVVLVSSLEVCGE